MGEHIRTPANGDTRTDAHPADEPEHTEAAPKSVAPETKRTEVLIVGGGMVGLSVALFLARQGVRPVLVEKHQNVAVHPRARGVNPRTMELLRGVGLEEVVRETDSGRALAQNSGVIAVETLTGKEIGELRQTYHADSGADYSELSPTPWCLCHQDELEPILRDRARELGADLRFGVELVSFEQDDDGVRALVRNRLTGAERVISATYLIAADGAGSPVRAALGIPVTGPGALARFVNIRFEADLREALGDRRFIICYTTGAGARCALLPIDNAFRWLLHVIDDGGPDAPGFTDERCVELVRAATGIPDLEVRVQDALPWDAAGQLADRFREGRVFLVGDAAHLMPPSGAFGSNTGIADAHNLAWKLAAVLAGQAGDALLDTYDAERRPVARATIEQAVLRSKDRPRFVHQEPSEPDPRIQSDPTVMFHYRYHSTAVVPAVGADLPTGPWLPDPAAVPGTRAPHVVLELAGAKLTTLDLFGEGFVLLTEPGADWAPAAGAAAAATGARLRVVPVHDDGATPGPGPRSVDTPWREAYAAVPGEAILVRPDGFVAWRSGPHTPAGPAELTAALRQVLAMHE
ncbi:FAD-dependent oxidoreductase [Streptomyces acidicola]|uniref:FAD-dependent oxidoreductase n=1 Tax=Streptomyces acidicola TaxID=2596892 RepID=UPI00381A1F30